MRPDLAPVNQVMKCRFCAKLTEVLPSRNDPPDLHLLLTRCGDCYPAHPEPITIEYYTKAGRRIYNVA